MASRKRAHSASEHAWIGAAIRRARLKAGFTQTAAAACIGQTQSTFAKIERGERQLTALELRDLCGAFGISASSILDDVDT